MSAIRLHTAHAQKPKRSVAPLDRVILRPGTPNAVYIGKAVQNTRARRINVYKVYNNNNNNNICGPPCGF